MSAMAGSAGLFITCASGIVYTCVELEAGGLG
jgi:hypothetical protein